MHRITLHRAHIWSDISSFFPEPRRPFPAVRRLSGFTPSTPKASLERCVSAWLLRYYLTAAKPSRDSGSALTPGDAGMETCPSQLVSRAFFAFMNFLCFLKQRKERAWTKHFWSAKYSVSVISPCSPGSKTHLGGSAHKPKPDSPRSGRSHYSDIYNFHLITNTQSMKSRSVAFSFCSCSAAVRWDLRERDVINLHSTPFSSY